MEIMKRLVQEEEGQGLVEYALIIAIISIVIVAAGPAVAAAIQAKFTEIAGELN
jgi:pilus assembly protein Flp/PilA